MYNPLIIAYSIFHGFFVLFGLFPWNDLHKMTAEFWKRIPQNEPYRVILGGVRDKLYNTRERARQLLANGVSDIPEDTTFTNVDQVCP